jgi:hypothetical protein
MLFTLFYSRLKPLKLAHHKRKGVSSILNSAFVSCISSLVSCPTRMRHHFSRNSEIGSSTRDIPSTINLSTDDLPHIQMHNSLDQSTAEGSSTLSHVQAGERLARFPETPLLPPFPPYLPLSPSFIDSAVCQPDQVYHRPFCGPSIYPVTRPSQLEGIMVTVHRHASIDVTV